MKAMREEDQGKNCTACNSAGERWLHDVRHRGIYRRLCATCVLKLHCSFFCPICLEVYADGFPPENNIKCPDCSSSVHAACISPELIPNYACLCCVKEFAFLGPIWSRSSRKGDQAKPAVVDLPTAKIILAASQIAAISMARAAAAAWVDADRKVKDSAVAKKRAREALLLASSKVEIQNSVKPGNQKKVSSDGKSGVVKVQEMEKPIRGAVNASSAKKQSVNVEEDDSLKVFTNSLLLQHRNVQNKINAERGRTKPNEHMVFAKTLPHLNKNEQGGSNALKLEEDAVHALL